MRIRVLAGFAFSAMVMGAAEIKIKLQDLPPLVQSAVKQQSAGATIKGFTKEIENGRTTYEAEMTISGHGKDVSFDASGRVVSVEEEVAIESLPAPARAAIQKAEGNGKLNKVESVTENGKNFYEASINKNGKLSEIQIEADGSKVK